MVLEIAPCVKCSVCGHEIIWGRHSARIGILLHFVTLIFNVAVSTVLFLSPFCYFQSIICEDQIVELGVKTDHMERHTAFFQKVNKTLAYLNFGCFQILESRGFFLNTEMSFPLLKEKKSTVIALYFADRAAMQMTPVSQHGI